MLVLRMVEERFHRDTEGRPIREGRTPPELLKDGEIEYKTCPYPGSRYLHACPMNVSALRQTSAHWDEVIDALHLLRNAYAEVRGGYQPNLLDIWRVGQLGSALPWFYILHERATCPAYLAALSKATLGIGIWGHREFVGAFSTGQVPERWTSQLIYETGDANGTFISDTEVCSAGEKMMLKFFDAFTADTVTVTGAGEVAALLPRKTALMTFGAHYVTFKQYIWLYWLARRFLYHDLVAALGALPAPYADLLDPTGEPPDFFLLQPQDPARLAPAQRTQWFRGLAAFLEPFAPDGSDAPLKHAVLRLADAMGHTAADPITRVRETYAQLDTIFADVLATVEAGLGGAAGATFTPEMRDRIIGGPPRAMLAALSSP